MKVQKLLAAGGARGLGRVAEAVASAVGSGGDEVLRQLITELRNPDADVVHPAARALKKVAEQKPELMASHAKAVLRVVRSDDEAMQDVRTRWQMTIVLGCLPLSGRDRAVAVDLLFERLLEDSPLQKTFAMQALFDLSAGDEALRARVMPVVYNFAENGTASMRARARRLLRQGNTLSSG